VSPPKEGINSYFNYNSTHKSQRNYFHHI